LQALERVVEAARVVHARYIGFSACMETDMAKLEKALAALERSENHE
jgi:methanogenic corrinoid protein MtbC1